MIRTCIDVTTVLRTYLCQVGAESESEAVKGAGRQVLLAPWGMVRSKVALALAVTDRGGDRRTLVRFIEG